MSATSHWAQFCASPGSPPEGHRDLPAGPSMDAIRPRRGFNARETSFTADARGESIGRQRLCSHCIGGYLEPRLYACFARPVSSAVWCCVGHVVLPVALSTFLSHLCGVGRPR
ncbi:hypothetical protein L227DRAFT_206699 [Lentinus tigrinus ALCF2SS1-6]|uniref:Uncharacterized protein n=1 Tax=Lentinus tigrinus ALCF2SS1-6 TaxID=1328759 RepID=A0A5C2SPJ1_9APHY|nr:hypothetical protein L227DRAFT_206699 [Lentinus tigrinus ALCF2SS1-6]